VALAGMMTTALRGALQAAVPGFLINAPEARTGKTYLVNLIGLLATGHIPPSTAGAAEDRPDEIEKRIETAALSGRPIKHLNNLPNGMILDSARLSELITEGVVTIRKLGRHAEGECDCRATTVFLNGNNVQVAGDLVPRILLCRLDARIETPETPEFKSDPMAMVRKDRGAYLAAIFTIVRAYMHADKASRPAEMHRVAGFEKWSQLVQQSLIWLGIADPYGNITRMRAADTTLDELQRLHKVLREIFKPTDKFTTALCRKKAEEQIPDMHGYKYRHLELRELMTVNGKFNPEIFGRLLGKHKNRITDGCWYYRPAGTLDGSAAYMLCGPQSAQPDAEPI
jgi:putative DNA primase/helicase